MSRLKPLENVRGGKWTGSGSLSVDEYSTGICSVLSDSRTSALVAVAHLLAGNGQRRPDACGLLKLYYIRHEALFLASARFLV